MAERNREDEIDDLRDHWSAAGGTGAHPKVREYLYTEARRLGVNLPGQPGA